MTHYTVFRTVRNAGNKKQKEAMKYEPEDEDLTPILMLIQQSMWILEEEMLRKISIDRVYISLEKFHVLHFAVFRKFLQKNLMYHLLLHWLILHGSENSSSMFRPLLQVPKESIIN